VTTSGGFFAACLAAVRVSVPTMSLHPRTSLEDFGTCLALHNADRCFGAVKGPNASVLTAAVSRVVMSTYIRCAVPNGQLRAARGDSRA
jgi:hypothetical protein